MDRNNQITVVIASYRYGHLVAHALESVLSQTQKPDKIFVVDDGVGDCKHIPKLYPEVTFIERPQNMGTVDNFQDMLMRVDTDKCMFLGADNWLRPDTLEKLDAIDADIVSYDWAITGDEGVGFAMAHRGKLENGYYIKRFEKGNMDVVNYIHGSSLYNTQKAQAVGYKASGNSRTEEDWMLFKGMINNGATHAHLPEPMLYYRKHRTNFNPNN